MWSHFHSFKKIPLGSLILNPVWDPVGVTASFRHNFGSIKMVIENVVFQLLKFICSRQSRGEISIKKNNIN